MITLVIAVHTHTRTPPQQSTHTHTHRLAEADILKANRMGNGKWKMVNGKWRNEKWKGNYSRHFNEWCGHLTLVRRPKNICNLNSHRNCCWNVFSIGARGVWWMHVGEHSKRNSGNPPMLCLNRHAHIHTSRLTSWTYRLTFSESDCKLIY